MAEGCAAASTLESASSDVTTVTDASKPLAQLMTRTKRSSPRRRRWIALAVLLAAYPSFVLGTTYFITLKSGLAGGRNGPCDAYRHCLASAIVAWTSSPRCVQWVTSWMEGDEAGDSHRMDAHNNRVGIRIAARAEDWSSLLRDVRTAVDLGDVADASSLADPDRIAWLTADRWRERWW